MGSTAAVDNTAAVGEGSTAAGVAAGSRNMEEAVHFFDPAGEGSLAVEGRLAVVHILEEDKPINKFTL